MPTTPTTSTTTATVTTLINTSTTTTTTQPTRGPPPAEFQTGMLPPGMLRIRPGALVTSEQVVALADAYLRKQQPFVLPLDQLPQNWNFTTNISSVEDNGWSIVLSFSVVDLGKTYVATPSPPKNSVMAATTSFAPSTTSGSSGSNNVMTTTTVTAGTGTGGVTEPPAAVLSEEQHIANALAKVLSDACNVRFYHPSSFTGQFAACTGRTLPLGASTDADYANGEWGHRALPIPRQARDPTNVGASKIPEWALVLGCVAAAILGWAIGMLVAFAVCPKLPFKSLKDRLLDDEDEVEQELGEIARAKLASLLGCLCCCCCCDGGKVDGNDHHHQSASSRSGDDDIFLKQQEMMEQSLLPPPFPGSSAEFMTSPQRQQHYEGDAMDFLMRNNNNTNNSNGVKKKSKSGKNNNYSRHEEL